VRTSGQAFLATGGQADRQGASTQVFRRHAEAETTYASGRRAHLVERISGVNVGLVHPLGVSGDCLTSATSTAQPVGIDPRLWSAISICSITAARAGVR